MGLSFTVDTSGMTVIRETIETASERAEHILAIQVEKDTTPFVPALTGSMTQRTRVVGSDIIYPGPQSKYLYYGKLMVDPNTGSSYAPKGGTKVLTDRELVFTKTMHAQAQSHWFEASKAQNLDKWLRIAGKLVKNGRNN